jgi:hypothetical protein
VLERLARHHDVERPVGEGQARREVRPHRLHAEPAPALFERRLVDVGDAVAGGVELEQRPRPAADLEEALAGDPAGEQLGAQAGGRVEADHAPVAVPLLVVPVELLQTVGHRRAAG